MIKLSIRRHVHIEWPTHIDLERALLLLVQSSNLSLHTWCHWWYIRTERNKVLHANEFWVGLVALESDPSKELRRDEAAWFGLKVVADSAVPGSG